jgi:AraC-like DNA-binding protein
MKARKLIKQIDEATRRNHHGKITDDRLSSVMGYNRSYFARMKNEASDRVLNHLRAVLMIAEKGLLPELEKLVKGE